MYVWLFNVLRQGMMRVMGQIEESINASVIHNVESKDTSTRKKHMAYLDCCCSYDLKEK